MKLYWVLLALVYEAIGMAACPDLKEPIDLKERMPKLALAADKSYTLPTNAEEGFPVVLINKVKFVEAPKTAVIDSVKNGAFTVRLAQNKIENEQKETRFSPNSVGFQIITGVGGDGLAGFYVSYFESIFNKPDLKGKITKGNQDGVFLFDASYKENNLEWKMKMTLTGTKITNLELTHPVYKEVSRQEENRGFKVVGNQTLCIESYGSVEVVKDE